jgi:hypothetical protein
VKLPESLQLRLTRLYPSSLYKSAMNIALIATPAAKNWGPSSGAAPMVDTSLLEWATEAIQNLAPLPVPKKASST